MKCLFCQILQNKTDIIYENEYFYVIYDHFPVSKGHTLIIPKRHIEDYFSLTFDEASILHQTILLMKELLDQEFQPDGYNIGINNGEAAGQSIFHLHIHLIPRYIGDVVQPKGGVRGVIPGKQSY